MKCTRCLGKKRILRPATLADIGMDNLDAVRPAQEYAEVAVYVPCPRCNVPGNVPGEDPCRCETCPHWVQKVYQSASTMSAVSLGMVCKKFMRSDIGGCIHHPCNEVNK